MLFSGHCYSPKKDYEKAENLFKPLENAAADFAENHKLFVDKWYHDGQTVLLQEKNNLNFQDIRRQINLVFNINKNELLLSATAYQDTGERKLRNISVINFCLPVTPEKLLHYLDISWRTVCSIKTEELLPQDIWQEDACAQSAALRIDYWC